MTWETLNGTYCRGCEETKRRIDNRITLKSGNALPHKRREDKRVNE